MPLGGAIVGGLVLGGVGSYLGAKEQGDAAAEAAKLTAQQVQDAQSIAGAGADSANWLLKNATPQVQDYLSQGYAGNLDSLSQGFGQARQDLLGASNLSAGAIAHGQGGALSSLYGGAGQGVGYLNSAQQGVDTAINSGLARSSDLLMNRQDRAGAMLDQPGGLYGNFQEDPGYRFRYDEGMRALQSSQAARGGRFGGAAMKELERYGQGMAAQGYNDFVGRQNALYGAASQSDAMGLQARSQLSSLYGQGASQLAGAQQSLGSQAANMAYGAGQGAAGIIGSGASQLSDIYGRTGTQLGGLSTQAGGAYGSAAQGYYGGLADLAWKSAGQQGQNIMGASGVATQALPTLAGANQAGIPYAGAAWNALGGMGNQAASLSMMYLGSKYGGGSTPAPTGG